MSKYKLQIGDRVKFSGNNVVHEEHGIIVSKSRQADVVIVEWDSPGEDYSYEVTNANIHDLEVAT